MSCRWNYTGFGPHLEAGVRKVVSRLLGGVTLADCATKRARAQVMLKYKPHAYLI